ncbi:endoplasmic reticulum membrane [Spatholobus suberectus]|nr:endoplasmic reticulum membrane [Spatholobus suberectus]
MDPPLPKSSVNPNKHLKEEFVSNLSGSSMLEIAALTMTIPILVLIRHSISSIFITGASLKKKNDDATSGNRNFKSYLATLSLDFLVIVVPMLLFFTVLANWTYILATLFTILTLLYIAAKRSGGSSPSFEGEPNSLQAYITSYRVIMMIITFLCILAVDFGIFPRRYAKTETYGTSLMDLGVGAFVLANSLVSRQARNIITVSWKTSIVSTSPLIILGFLRLVTTTGVDYQVHVGEYGVHWNFFFTLAAVSILTSFINISPQYSGILGSLVLVGYQFCLMHGLNHYLLSNERGMDILSQNKEGIFSIFGYWGMYLLGVHLGNYLFFGSYSSGFRSSRWVRMRVWVLSILFWSLTVLLDRHVERISRRTCNLPYVTMVLADNLQLLSILMLADLVPGSKSSILEEAFNRNLLATFLLANILTGLVNLSVDTLSASSVTALFILFVYAYILSIVIGIADYFEDVLFREG